MNTGNGVLATACAALVLLVLALVMVGQEFNIRALQMQIQQQEGRP